MSRGSTWIAALGDAPPQPAGAASVLRAGWSTDDDEPGTLLAVVPDPASRFPRARRGEVGLAEALALAEALEHVADVEAGRPAAERSPMVAVVDVPSQAYGRAEEAAGLHLHLAAAVDAAARARRRGHPVLALLVGTARSGGWLAHGAQADEVLALDDVGVSISAMRTAAAARVTRRTVEELDELADRVLPLAHDVGRWTALGLNQELVEVRDADDPTAEDVRRVRGALTDAVRRARAGRHDLSARWTSAAAAEGRAATLAVRARLAAEW